MALIRLNNTEIEVDVLEELEPYLHLFPRSRQRDNKLQSCSPFREETNPSFAVNLDNGTWIDSGSTDDNFKKGGFISLLMFLKNSGYMETVEYLAEKYHFDWTKEDVPVLNIDIELDRPQAVMIPRERFRQYLYRHPYLERRGLSEATQKRFSIGYDPDGNAVAIPWFNYRGKMINIKFRSVEGKKFWYLQDGDRVHDHVYGLHLVKRDKLDYAFLVESEIDAMTLWEVGQPAIAFGGSHLSKRQEYIMRSMSGLNKVITATDNDEVGQSFKQQLVDSLGGYMEVEEFIFPQEYKDINEIPLDHLKNLLTTNIKKIDIIKID